MEIRARYTLIGAFILAAIAGIFGFVYWINSGGGGQRAHYQIRYENTVSGLIKGSAVLFNGVRVGEVTSLQLDPSAPRRIKVAIAVDLTTPVRTDTRVGIDFQGLSGAPVVALSGGTAATPLLPVATGALPLLIADADAGIGLTQTARDAIRKIDAVVSENAEPLKNLIANIDKFSGALARNSDRIDGILSGVERLTGGGAKVPARVVDLAAATAFPGLTGLPQGQMVVTEPTSLLSLDTTKIMVRGGEGEVPDLTKAQYGDALPKIFHLRVVQSFENAGYVKTLGRQPDGMTPDYQIILDIRAFEVLFGPKPLAKVAYGVKLLGTEGRVLQARVFQAEQPVAALDVDAVGAALDAALKSTLSDLVVWACNSAVAVEQGQGPPPKKSVTP